MNFVHEDIFCQVRDLPHNSTMRQGQYEILLLSDDGGGYEERQLLGKTCVRAEPGKEYNVRINVYRDARGNFPAKYLRFGLFVDGVDVQYWKRIDLSDDALLPTNPLEPVSSRFWGFKKNVNDIRSFVFSVPDTSTNSYAHSAEEYKCLGSVKLEVYEACVTYGTYENQSGQFEAPSTQQIGESAKFWQQASLTTAAGRKIELEKEKFLPLPRWKNLRKVPDEVLVVQYHTASMMDFLEENLDKLKDETKKSNDSSGAKRKKVVYDLTSDAEASDGEGKHSTACSEQATDSLADHASKKNKCSDDHVIDNEGNNRPATPSEFPIDEDISIVVQKKVVPFLDLSDEREEEVRNLAWGTISS